MGFILFFSPFLVVLLLFLLHSSLLTLYFVISLYHRLYFFSRLFFLFCIIFKMFITSGLYHKVHSFTSIRETLFCSLTIFLMFFPIFTFVLFMNFSLLFFGIQNAQPMVAFTIRVCHYYQHQLCDAYAICVLVFLFCCGWLLLPLQHSFLVNATTICCRFAHKCT